MTVVHGTSYASSMLISIARDGQEIGEWSEYIVRAFYQDGQLVGTDQYWHEGMSEWRSLRDLFKPTLPPSTGPAATELPPALPELPPLPPATRKEVPEPVTAIEEAAAKMGPFPEGWAPATFRRRTMARTIDYFILTIGSGMVMCFILIPLIILGMPPAVYLWLTIVLTYIATTMLFFAWDWVWVSWTGTSPGKWLYGLRVVRLDGTESITSDMAARRSRVLLRSLWFLILYPYWTFLCSLSAEASFSRTGLTAWDKTAGSVVVGLKIGVLRMILAVTVTLLSFLGILVWSLSSMTQR